MSAGNINNDCPIPYQLCSFPSRPRTPNSGYSFGNTGGSAVQSACVACNRCCVSAVPSSPDCTAKAMSAETRTRRKRGSRDLYLHQCQILSMERFYWAKPRSTDRGGGEWGQMRKHDLPRRVRLTVRPSRAVLSLANVLRNRGDLADNDER